MYSICTYGILEHFSPQVKRDSHLSCKIMSVTVVRGPMLQCSVIVVSPTQGVGGLRPAGNPSLYIFVAGGCFVTASSGNHKQHEGRAHTE